ncbi:MAG: translation initiation factor [Bacteroidota bacterium]
MAKKNNWKNREGVVYSTDDNFEYNHFSDALQETLENSSQSLRVELDKKSRGGKKVTIVTGFVGAPNDLKELGKLLKSKCGVGGATKDGEILIQGDFRKKVGDILSDQGYKVRVI